MTINYSFFRRVALLGALAGISVSAPAQAPSLAMFQRLEKGLWELSERDRAGARHVVQSVCLGDARRHLVQVQHPSSDCSQYVISDQPDQITISYSCRNTGQGRTSVRAETSRVVQISTQGFLNGQPFSQSLEGRRIRSC